MKPALFLLGVLALILLLPSTSASDIQYPIVGECAEDQYPIVGECPDETPPKLGPSYYLQPEFYLPSKLRET
ncbi:MAG: hypothetical protein Q8P05_01280 [Candidatus Diapherotrites archaeon]|nr:hypothetical protein [Candidatus Diapherotrites archaeon]